MDSIFPSHSKRDFERYIDDGMDNASSPNWVECFIPLQALQIGGIELQEPRKQMNSSHTYDKSIAALKYTTESFKLESLNLLTPFMKVANWDSSSGRLDFELEFDSISYKKLIAIQDTIIKQFQAHSTWLTEHGSSKEEFKQNFQQIVKHNIFSVYLHGQNQDTRPTGRVWIWKDGAWTKGATPTSFKRGQQLRVAFRLQGVCFLHLPGFQTRLRLQHQTVAVIQKVMP